MRQIDQMQLQLAAMGETLQKQWGAVGRMLERLDALEARLDVVEGRADALKAEADETSNRITTVNAVLAAIG